ncbi:MAG: IS3 family transposase [Enterococcus sp.]|nr:IS3 family transposase [Enterococcus sp.]
MQGDKNSKINRKRRSVLMGVSRTNSYRKSTKKDRLLPSYKEKDVLAAMEIIEQLHLRQPAIGIRKFQAELAERGLRFTRYAVGKICQALHIKAVTPKPYTSKPAKHHKKFPYLLNDIAIDRPNQVWTTDLSALPLGTTFMYINPIMDWHSRAILGYTLNDTMATEPIVECFKDTIEEFGTPEILNSDQGSNYTSNIFVNTLAENEIKQSMDGKGRWVDNVVMERWFRTLKTEWLSIHEYTTPRELRKLIDEFIEIYNNERRHASLNYQLPMEFYKNEISKVKIAA